jgi:putative spermidine/putrescine transport system substrate-binding protein
MKHLRTLFLLGATALSSPALAQQTLYFAGYSGDFQTMFEKEIIPEFQAKHNVKVVYVAGNSSEVLAKLQAQKGNQEINVILVDNGPMQQAIQFGFCDKVTEAPVYKDIYDVASAATFGGRAVGVGLVATGIAYNKDSFEKNGWAPPTSWNDLTDPKFEQRVASNPISGTYGLNMLLMFARLNGGGEKNIEPGFKAVREKLVPNVLSWSSSNAQLAQMFQNGDIDVAVWGSSRAIALKQTGFPVEFAYPKEGAPAIVASACAVADNKLPEASQALLQYLASPDVQVKLATQGFGPTNRQTKLEGTLAAELPYSEEKLSKLINVDWPVINPQRAEWTNQWNRTVER